MDSVQQFRASDLKREWALLLAGGAIGVLMLGGGVLAPVLAHPAGMVVVLIAICGLVLGAALAIVRHADELAHRLGEPGGTLLLTLTITGLEAAMVGLVMSTGEEKPELARDTMFAVVMLVMNGFLGIALVLGGRRHSQQAYNSQSANAFLAMIIPFCVLTLLLPNFTKASAGPTLTSFQMAYLSAASVGIYGIFLLVQNRWHRDFFVYAQQSPNAGAAAEAHEHHSSGGPMAYHIAMLSLYGVAVVLLAKKMTEPMDAVVLRLGAPAALAGFIVALLVLTPESIAAVKAANRNQLQRSINILLGSVLASIGLTVPIVVTVALVTGRTLILGLEPAQMVLLALTLVVSIVTFSTPRTNLLLGCVHLLLFAAAALLIFDR